MINDVGKHFFYIVLLLLLSSCQTSIEKASPPETFELITQSLETEENIPEQQPVPVPNNVQNALIPPVQKNSHGLTVEKKSRFDISVREMPAREFYMNLVQDTPYNIIVHPSINGNITLTLKSVTISDVMEITRKIYGYDYESTRFGYEVLPTALQSRAYTINYLNVLREGSSATTVSAGQVSQADSGSDSSDDSDSSSSESTRSTVAGSQVNTNHKADFWGELQKNISTLIGTGQGRAVIINSQSGMVIVRAFPDELRIVEEFLDTAQRNLHRQVILEAKILEVQLQSGYQSGINWAAVFKASNGRNITLGQVGGGTSLSGQGISSIAGVTGISGATGNLDPSNYAGVANANIEAFGGVFSAAVNLNDFTAFIDLLETQGNVHVLSSPRIATINNQKAIIKVGEDEYFVTDVSNPQVVGGDGTVTQTPEVELTPFFSGIALDVTPQISVTDIITLHVHPTVSQVSEQIKNIEIEGLDQRLPLARSVIRESDSIVRSRSGHIVVIGGLMKTNTDEITASVPVLGDLPFIGNAFRHIRQQTTKSELVILIKPIIVGKDTWSTRLTNARERFNRLQQGFRSSSIFPHHSGIQ